jgi:hypothetical protein
MQRQVAQLQVQDCELERQVDAAAAAVQEIRSSRQAAAYDVTLKMHLKQGQVG